MERKYNETDALRAAQIIFKRATKVKKLNRGYSHDIYEVETNDYPEKVIIRFSNKNPIENSISKEIRINQIMNNLGLPVPRVILHDKTKKIVPYEFIILSKLDGEDLDSLWEKITKKEQIEIMEKIGEVIGRIHNIKFKEFGSLTPKKIKVRGRFSLKKVGEGLKVKASTFDFFDDAFEFISGIASFEIINPELIKNLVNYVLENKKLTETSEDPSLIHGDFDIINFRVKKIKGIWQITGLLDFEYSASKMREYDFIKLHRNGFLEKGNLRDSLLKGYKKYQKINPEFDEKIKYFRTCRDIGFAGILLKSGDKDYAKKILENVKITVGFTGKIFMNE